MVRFQILRRGILNVGRHLFGAQALSQKLKQRGVKLALRR
jgi:hypothetical protein